MDKLNDLRHIVTQHYLCLAVVVSLWKLQYISLSEMQHLKPNPVLCNVRRQYPGGWGVTLGWVTGGQYLLEGLVLWGRRKMITPGPVSGWGWWQGQGGVYVVVTVLCDKWHMTVSGRPSSKRPWSGSQVKSSSHQQFIEFCRCFKSDFCATLEGMWTCLMVADYVCLMVGY